MKKLLTLALTTALLTLATIGSAFAMDLTTAKHSGLIGERADGLVATMLPNPSPDLKALVDSTNQGRLEIYKQSADKQNIPLREVQAIAAQKIYDMAAPGDYLFINGAWKQK